MRLDLENLPADVNLLHRLVRDMAAAVESRDGEIERLQAIVKQFQRARFGRRSERLDPDQFALGLEDLDTDIAHVEASRPAPKDAAREQPRRKPLPEHLPRDEVLLDIDGEVCACCGGALHAVGESVSEMLDWLPAQLRVLRIRRPKYGCRACGKLHQAAAPERPIVGGLATPALLAQVLVAKYCDHTPLHRQAQILARHGAGIDRSTLAGWVGGACWWLDALHEKLCRHVFASDHLFADDTPVPVLDPGRGRTKTGRLWVYARDQRAWGGPAPPAAVYLFAPDRKAERPAAHLEDFKGILHVDGYAGFETLTGDGDVVLAACWAHARRKFYDVAEAIRYALSRWDGLTRFLKDGRVELDTNPVERAIRPVALGRKNHLFAGSDRGGKRWATVCSLIETAKMNGVEPYAYLKDVLQRMVEGHTVNPLDDLMPCAWKAEKPVKT